MITFLTTFILLLIIGSLFTSGFHTVTRGEIQVLPNGEEIEEKELLGSWQIFFEQIDGYRKVFYEGEQMEMKLKILEQLKPAYMNEITFSTKEKRSLFFEKPLTDAEVRDIEWTLNCKVFKNGDVIFLYENEPIYRFSEWVRKMTNCPKCFSGWMGTLTFFIFNHFYPETFYSENEPTLKLIVFWVVYCISLVSVNSLFKEYFSHKQK